MTNSDLKALAEAISKVGGNHDTCEHLRNIALLISAKESQYLDEMKKQNLGEHVCRKFSENIQIFKKWIKHQPV